MLQVSIKKQLNDFPLDINFTVKSQTLVLFGPSGCGKTTILRCIAGLVRPDEGRIALRDKLLYSSADKIFLSPRQRNIGYMFQDYALFPHMDISKNIKYGIKNYNEENETLYKRLMELLKIQHLAKRYSSQLSGGEKQRVALARSLMAEPDLLLLDEPLSSLDNETRQELQAELKEMQRLWNIPFILVTHDSDEAKLLGDEVIFINQGKQLPMSPNWEKSEGMHYFC